MRGAIAALAALGQPTRLRAFRQLMGAHPSGLAAGAIARRCRVPHNTMSTHLAVLARAGLVKQHRDGRTVCYSVRLEGFRALLSFLTRDCCGGRPDVCVTFADLMEPSPAVLPAEATDA